MAAGRVFASATALLAVGACAALAIGMSRATGPADPAADDLATALATQTQAAPTWAAHSAVPAAVAVPVAGSVVTVPSATRTAPSSSPQPTPRTSAATHPRTSARARVTAAPRTPSAQPQTVAPPAVRGGSLPIGGATSGASRVITVVARSYSSTTATLQAWDRAPGGGWLRVGPAITAHVGADGLSTSPSETRSATPIGSFTLTQAFGALGNPGTGLPYFRTDGADWWISQAGPLYNTHQHCWTNCSFRLGSPNEHLASETPYYNYAVVIDYNTRNSATGVRQGAGSAFFLHVTDGTPTAGCVAIPQGNLVTIMRWLTPAAHPRILIGVG